MDRDLLYVAVAKKKVEYCIRPEIRAEWQGLRTNNCIDSFNTDAVANFFHRTCCVKHK